MDRRKYNTKGLLHPAYNTKENVIKISRHEKFEHALAKFLLAYELIHSGQDVITEAIFQNGKRADVLALQEGVAYEILCSESKKSILAKAKQYPVEIKPFKADQVIKQALKAFLK